jgi:hypothetical protein
VTLEKSVLEQANSQYEVQGEYVLRGQRAGEKERDEEVMWERAMAGQLGTFITSMGRWRLRLDVPHAEVSEMLPVARLLSRSSDPAVLSRSKELFLQGVQTAGFSAENLKELLEVCMYVCFGQYDEFQNSLLQKCCKLMPFTLSIGSVAPQIYPIVSSEFRPLEADCGAQSTLYQSYA